MRSTELKKPLSGLSGDPVGTTPPISFIPPEILGEIFLKNILSRSLYRRQEALTSLCLVSRWWKHIAYSIPRLWTTFYVEHMDEREANDRLLWITRFFGRSGGLPISLMLRPMRHGHWQRSAWKTLSNLRIVSPHVSNLHLYLPENIARDEFHLQSAGLSDWSRLETLKLELYLGGDGSAVPPTSAAGLKAHMPRLVNLYLRSIPVEGWVLSTFPWAQLVSLHILGKRMKSSLREDLFLVLSQCRDLEECSFPVSHSYGRRGPRPLPLVHLSKLRRVAIDLAPVCRDVVDSALLAPLRLPALDSLTLTSTCYGGAGVSPSAIHSLVAKSGCNLRRLTLRGISLSEAEYITLFEGLEGLETLRIEKHHIPYKFLRHGAVSCGFLPRLRSLTLESGVSPFDSFLRSSFDIFVDVRRRGHERNCKCAQISSSAFMPMVQHA